MLPSNQPAQSIALIENQIKNIGQEVLYTNNIYLFSLIPSGSNIYRMQDNKNNPRDDILIVHHAR